MSSHIQITALPDRKQIQLFNSHLKKYYAGNRRDFAWRNTVDPYRILVSEIMLQQTQTARVAIKYEQFLKKFPTVKELAKSPLSNVLKEWRGLGYNRRALFLKRTAETVVETHNGIFPRDRELLLKLPGIGQSTAGALMAFAWNVPVPFIETNIRSVFIHFFFKKNSSEQDTLKQPALVRDSEILQLIEKTIDQKNPRDWYYALYDYGAMLKQSKKSSLCLNKQSAHYKKQSKFQGSDRQIRAIILREIIKFSSISKPLSASKSASQSPSLSEKELLDLIAKQRPDITPNDTQAVQKITDILEKMERELILIRSGTKWYIAQ